MHKHLYNSHSLGSPINSQARAPINSLDKLPPCFALLAECGEPRYARFMKDAAGALEKPVRWLLPGLTECSRKFYVLYKPWFSPTFPQFLAGAIAKLRLGYWDVARRPGE